jgi:hypothetical protein
MKKLIAIAIAVIALILIGCSADEIETNNNNMAIVNQELLITENGVTTTYLNHNKYDGVTILDSTKPYFFFSETIVNGQTYLYVYLHCGNVNNNANNPLTKRILVNDTTFTYTKGGVGVQLTNKSFQITRKTETEISGTFGSNEVSGTFTNIPRGV